MSNAFGDSEFKVLDYKVLLEGRLGDCQLNLRLLILAQVFISGL